MIQQSDPSFEALNQRIYRHLEERDWLSNDPRSLAISICLEAAELLEHFQWQPAALGDNEALGDELADILIYAIQFAQKTDIDIAEAIERKLQKAADKYPASDYKDKTAAERRQNWLNAKINYRTDKKGL
jgi:NTP pyrophosphatase (non-canonical NTP hydrolase)